MKQRVAIARVLANDADVVVMSPGPGRIETEMRIDLPRPRDVSAPDFNDIRRELSRMLHSDVSRKAA